MKKDAQQLQTLPAGWNWIQASEIGDVQLGRQRSPKNRSAQFPTPYLRAANITESGLDLSDVLEMEFKPTERARYRLEEGDIVLSEASGSASQVGKPALWRKQLPLCCFQNTVIRLRPRRADPRYLLWLFTHFYRNGMFSRVAGGVGINHLSAAKFSMLDLPIAPPDAQTRVVAEIEKQFTRLEAGVAALRRVQANLKRYRATVLKAACEGRLVPTEAELARKEGRTYDTGKQLLASILDSRRRLRTLHGEYKAPVATDDDIASLPVGWAGSTLDAVADIKGGITKDQKRKHSVPARVVPYLRVANVQRGYLDLREVKQIDATEEEIRELALRKGDVLFNEGGDRDKLGRGWIWNDELPECIHQNHVFRARLYGGELNPRFVSWYANTVGQKFFFDEGKHTTNLASISMSKLKGLPVLIPPAAEQVRIVAEVERRLSVIDELEVVVTANLQRATRLRQSILERAFSGRLHTNGAE